VPIAEPCVHQDARASDLHCKPGHGRDSTTKHSEEFKQEAVRIALTSGLPRDLVASDL
jgi:transposase-like protein